MGMDWKAPRCGSCGRLMEVYSKGNDTVVYECCGQSKALPKKEHTFTSQHV